MPDSEPLLLNEPDDLLNITTDLGSQIQFKFLGLMLVVFIILSSDTFINRILSRFKGALDFKTITSWGVFLQGMFLVFIMLIIDLLIKQRII